MNKDYVVMFCKCGCGEGVVLKSIKDVDDSVSLQLVSDNFYSYQESTFIAKLKRIWSILTNKEYCYFDICIEDDELQQFKSFVEKL